MASAVHLPKLKEEDGDGGRGGNQQSIERAPHCGFPVNRQRVDGGEPPPNSSLAPPPPPPPPHYAGWNQLRRRSLATHRAGFLPPPPPPLTWMGAGSVEGDSPDLLSSVSGGGGGGEGRKPERHRPRRRSRLPGDHQTVQVKSLPRRRA